MVIEYKTYKQEEIKKTLEWAIGEINDFKTKKMESILDNLIGVLKIRINDLYQKRYNLWLYSNNKWFKSISGPDKNRLKKHGIAFNKRYDSFVVLPENFDVKSGLNNEVFQLILESCDVEVLK